MCGIDFSLQFGFLKKLGFGSEWVRFGSKNAVWFEYYSQLLLIW